MSKKKPVVHGTTPTFHDEQIPARWTLDKLVSHAVRDVNTPELWVGREAYLQTLQKHLDWHIRGTLKPGARLGMYHIIEVNNRLREKQLAARAVLAAAPAAPPPVIADGEDRIASILTQQAAEIAALRAENARLKNGSVAP